jgi:hypothetical protein
MADVEYKGVHVTGIKGSYLLVLFPLFASIVGGLWGGFELWSRYQAMEQKINEYVAPDLSDFDKRIDIMRGEVIALKELVADAQETARDIRTDIKGEVNKQHDQIAAVDKRSRSESQETRTIIRNAEKNFGELEMGMLSTIRDLISDTSKRWDDKLTKVDSQIENLEKKIDKKITKALENPLAAMSKSNSNKKKFPWKVQK